VALSHITLIVDDLKDLPGQGIFSELIVHYLNNISQGVHLVNIKSVDMLASSRFGQGLSS
jgi:hypothetical protein